MQEGLHDGCQTGAMLEDLGNLVTWVHSHAAICSEKPWQEGVRRTENGYRHIVCWLCNAGHAYRWQFTPVIETADEDGEVDGNKRRKRTHQDAMYDDADDVQYFGKDGHEEEADSDDSHSSLMTYASGERGDAPDRDLDDDLTANRVRKQRQQALAHPCSLWRPQAEGRSGYAIRMTKDKVWIERNQKSKADEKNSEEEEGLRPDDTVTAEDPPVPGLLDKSTSDTDSVPEDEGWNGPPGGAESLSPKPLSPIQQHEEPHCEASCSTWISPAAKRPCPATESAHLEEDMAEQPAKKKADIKQPKKTVGRPGNMLSFPRWLVIHGPAESHSLSSLPAAELDELLVSFLHHLCEAGGEELSSNSLLGHSRALERYLKSQSCTFSLHKSPELANARNALDTSCQELRWREMDREMDVILTMRREEEEELRQMGVLSRNSAESLLCLVLLNNLRAFGKGHLQRPWPLLFGEFRLANEPHPGLGDGAKLEYLEWTGPSVAEQCPLRMHGVPDNSERCPLQDFRVYASKQSGGFLSEYDAFYSTQRTHPDQWHPKWFSRHPMTRTRMEKLIKALSQHIQAIRARKGLVV